MQVFLDPIGDVRLPTLTQLDFRVDKTLTLVKGVKVQGTIDVFNVFNINTIVARSPIQNSSRANLIDEIVAPRLVRFGAVFSF